MREPLIIPCACNDVGTCLFHHKAREIAASLKTGETKALVNFVPGIYDAAWIFEQYTDLARRKLLMHRTGCRFDWTDLGRAVAAELEVA